MHSSELGIMITLENIESVVLDYDRDQFEEQFAEFEGIPQMLLSIPVIRKNKGNENSRRFKLLSEESISKVMVFNCIACRSTYRCPNNKCCRAKFGDPKNLEEIILHVRNTFYPLDGYPSHRLAFLLKTLIGFQTMYNTETKKSTIRFRINNIDVCKSFYHLVSGIPDRMFNETTAAVEGTGNGRKIDRLNK